MPCVVSPGVCLCRGCQSQVPPPGQVSRPCSLTPTYLLSLQPAAQGAFLRGSGLSLASGRFTAPVAAIFQFSASLHVGERGWARVRAGGWPSQVGPGTAVPSSGSHHTAASCSKPSSHWGLRWGPSAPAPASLLCPP